MKRWWIEDNEANETIPADVAKHRYIEVLSVEDHERIVAELKAQLEQSETKVTWLLRDNEKNVRERDAVIATQKRVIEKLTEQRNRAANRHHKQSLNKYLERISKFEEEIKAIEKGEA